MQNLYKRAIFRMISKDRPLHFVSSRIAMRIYLDNCVLNRPFDDKEQRRIRIETEAILEIRKSIEQGKIELAWSYVIDYEIHKNPIIERRHGNAVWKNLALIEIEPSTRIVSSALELRDFGLKDVDSLHVACAIEAKADYFVTTDDAIIKRSEVLASLLIISNPIDLLEVTRKL